MYVSEWVCDFVVNGVYQKNTENGKIAKKLSKS